MTIMIGIDPHKATHTAVAVDENEVVLGEFKVSASKAQVGLLCEWADGFEKREWAVESANGLGYLVARQLVAAGEVVLDVPHAGIAGPGIGIRPLKQERPQRCPGSCYSCDAIRSAGPGRCR